MSSVYKPLDLGVPSEVHVYDLARKRREAHTVPTTCAPPRRDDASHARRASPANEPFPATFKWVAALPHGLRPLTLLQRYPRIANALASGWSDPEAVRGYLFDLLIDRRGGRQGFPQAVQSELLALRAYLDEMHVDTPSARNAVRHGR